MKKQEIYYDTSLTDEMTVREVERLYNDVLMRGLNMDDTQLLRKTSAVKMWQTINKLRFTNEGMVLKIHELREWATIVRSEFIRIHRVNYAAYRTMENMYDWYESKRRLTPNVKRYWKKTEEAFRRYKCAHRDTLESMSWMVLQDHLSLIDDSLQERVAQVEYSILNAFIRQRGGMKVKGQIDDLELLTKAQVSLFYTRVLKYSFADFFHQYIKKCGVDFSYDFKYADLSSMSRNFVWMLEQMGIKLLDDKNGDKILAFFDVDNSSTIEVAWERLMKDLGDEDLADKKAKQAIDLNPELRQKYEKIFQQEEEITMEKSLERLGEKYNIKKSVV